MPASCGVAVPVAAPGNVSSSDDLVHPELSSRWQPVFTIVTSTQSSRGVLYNTYEHNNIVITGYFLPDAEKSLKF